jgi:hypothetical protein
VFNYSGEGAYVSGSGRYKRHGFLQRIRKRTVWAKIFGIDPQCKRLYVRGYEGIRVVREENLTQGIESLAGKEGYLAKPRMF